MTTSSLTGHTVNKFSNIHYPNICFYKQGKDCHNQALVKCLFCHLWQSTKEMVIHRGNNAWSGVLFGKYNRSSQEIHMGKVLRVPLDDALKKWVKSSNPKAIVYSSWLCKYSVALLYAQEKNTSLTFLWKLSPEILAVFKTFRWIIKSPKLFQVVIPLLLVRKTVYLWKLGL